MRSETDVFSFTRFAKETKRRQLMRKEIDDLRQKHDLCLCGCGQIAYEKAITPHHHTADYCKCPRCMTIDMSLTVAMKKLIIKYRSVSKANIAVVKQDAASDFHRGRGLAYQEIADEIELILNAKDGL